MVSLPLKKKDIRLLHELDTNYRSPYSRIGKKIHLSEQLISHKIKNFVKREIIKQYCPLIDYSRLGLLTFIVFFKVRYKSDGNFQTLIQMLQKQENIIAIEECDGKYDLVVTFAAKNPSSFNKKLKRLVSERPELRNWTILTTVVFHHYPRNHLINKEGDADTIIGGDREEIHLDEINKKVLQSLIKGKKKITEIAAAVGSTPKTCISRLRWLEQQGVVKGYRLLLNHRALGISSNVILIKHYGIAAEQEEKFTYFCKRHPQITQLTKTFGQWDAMLHVETKNRVEFRNLFLQIREMFDETIDDIDSFRVFTTHERKFLPDEVFNINV